VSIIDDPDTWYEWSDEFVDEMVAPSRLTSRERTKVETHTYPHPSPPKVLCLTLIFLQVTTTGTPPVSPPVQQLCTIWQFLKTYLSSNI
jgi:hypothetical protein